MKSDITYDEIIECQHLLKFFNYTIIEAPEEADSQLADLSKKNKIDYIITDDMDILIFGGQNILKNFTVSLKKEIQEIDLNNFKKDTNLSQSQLIDLSILLGCDYCPSVKGIGTIGAYNLIQKYKTLDNIIKKENIKLSLDYKKAQKYFREPPVINSNNIIINKLKVDKKNLIIFLRKYKFSDKYIDNFL